MKEITATGAYSHIKNLCKYGPRNINSEGDLKSIEYISKILKKYDFDILERPFKEAIYKEKKSELKIYFNNKEIPMECVSHYRSGNTPSEGIDAPIEYVGYGTEEEIKKRDVKDKICLADTGKIHPVAKADVAKKYGAAGCIWIHGHPGGIIAAWGLHRFGAPLPVIGISYEDGIRLRNILKEKKNIKAKMIVEASAKEGEGKNIIGYMRGKKEDEIVALCAHRETTHTTVGANDNGSGVSVLLEIAKAFHGVDLQRSLALIFSSGEEGGGFGVQDYLSSYPNEAKKYVVCINLDMVGEGSQLHLVEKGRKSKAEKYTFTSKWLNSLLLNRADKLGYYLDTNLVSDYGLADTGHFLDKNIHATWFYKPDDPYFHTKADTPDKVNPNDLKVTGDIVLETLKEIDNMKKIPKFGGE